MNADRRTTWDSPALALAVWLASGGAWASIVITPHNLSATGLGNARVSDTAEVCVFCHTPHGADVSAPAPLWNKALPPGVRYTTYDALGTTSLQGEVLPVGSVSLACLSCHDGTQAMDNLLNAPGPGGFEATGGGIIGRGYNWGASPRVDPDGRLTGTELPVLGIDLRDDHPIGIEYCGGGITGIGMTVNGRCADTDFIGPGGVEAGRLQTRILGGRQVFWVDTIGGVAGVREKTDIILYPRLFAGGIERPSVECGSCHDPHVERKNPNEVHFLRISPEGAGLCLSCHVK